MSTADVVFGKDGPAEYMFPYLSFAAARNADKIRDTSSDMPYEHFDSNEVGEKLVDRWFQEIPSDCSSAVAFRSVARISSMKQFNKRIPSSTGWVIRVPPTLANRRHAIEYPMYAIASLACGDGREWLLGDILDHFIHVILDGHCRSCYMGSYILNTMKAALPPEEQDGILTQEGVNRLEEYLRSDHSFFHRYSGKARSRSTRADQHWTKHTKGKSVHNFLEFDEIFFTFNKDQVHWILIAVFPKQKWIEGFDPMGNHGSTHFASYLILHWLGQLHRHNKRKHRGDFVSTEWTIATHRRGMDLQLDSYNCGPLCILYVLLITNHIHPHRLPKPYNTMMHLFRQNMFHHIWEQRISVKIQDKQISVDVKDKKSDDEEVQVFSTEEYRSMNRLGLVLDTPPPDDVGVIEAQAATTQFARGTVTQANKTGAKKRSGSRAKSGTRTSPRRSPRKKTAGKVASGSDPPDGNDSDHPEDEDSRRKREHMEDGEEKKKKNKKEPHNEQIAKHDSFSSGDDIPLADLVPDSPARHTRSHPETPAATVNPSTPSPLNTPEPPTAAEQQSIPLDTPETPAATGNPSPPSLLDTPDPPTAAEQQSIPLDTPESPAETERRSSPRLQKKQEQSALLASDNFGTPPSTGKSRKKRSGSRRTLPLSQKTNETELSVANLTPQELFGDASRSDDVPENQQKLPSQRDNTSQRLDTTDTPKDTEDRQKLPSQSGYTSQRQDETAPTTSPKSNDGASEDDSEGPPMNNEEVWPFNASMMRHLGLKTRHKRLFLKMYEEIEEGDVEVGRKSNLWLSDMLQKIHFLLSKLKLAKGRLIVPETEPTLEAKKGKSGTISSQKEINQQYQAWQDHAHDFQRMTRESRKLRMLVRQLSHNVDSLKQELLSARNFGGSKAKITKIKAKYESELKTLEDTKREAYELKRKSAPAEAQKRRRAKLTDEQIKDNIWRTQIRKPLLGWRKMIEDERGVREERSKEKTISFSEDWRNEKFSEFRKFKRNSNDTLARGKSIDRKNKAYMEKYFPESQGKMTPEEKREYDQYLAGMTGEQRAAQIEYDEEVKQAKYLGMLSNGYEFAIKRPDRDNPDALVVEKVNEGWVQNNFSEEFVKEVQIHNSAQGPSQGGMGKFLPIPVGNTLANKGNLDPNWLVLSVPIKYQQGNRKFCLVFSLCSALHTMGLEFGASAIAAQAVRISDQNRDTQLAEIRRLVEEHCPEVGRPEILCNKLVAQKKRKKKQLTMKEIVQLRSPFPILVLPEGTDGSVNHAFCVMGSMIFDSTLKFALESKYHTVDWLMVGVRRILWACHFNKSLVSKKGGNLKKKRKIA